MTRPTLGMLIPNLVDNYQTEWLGAVDAAGEQGADLICFVGSDLEDARGFRSQGNAIYELATRERLDGLIVWTTALQLFAGQEKMETFCRRFDPLPIVSVERVLPGAVSVLMDDRQGMHDAVSHLIEAHGRRRIAFILGPEAHPGMRERFEGYRDALADHGLAFTPTLVTPPLRAWHPEDAAAHAAKLLFDDSLEIDGLAAANDDLALAGLAAADMCGRRVPDDVAVVGYDDSVNISHHYLVWLERVSGGGAGRAVLERAVDLGVAVPLTTVRGPFYELSRRSVELLLARIRGETVADVETIPTELVVRRSCGCFSETVREPVPRSLAGAPRRAHGSPGLDAVTDSRAEIVADLEAALGKSALAPGWAERVVDAFVADLRGVSDDRCLRTLDELVRESPRTSETLDGLWRVLFVLRRRIVPLMSTDLLAPAVELWECMEMLVGEAMGRLSSQRYLVTLTRDEIVREVGQELLTAPDVERLADALVRELPKLGIRSCCLALYAPSEQLPARRDGARAVLVYENGKRRRIAAREAIFPAAKLCPRPLPQRGRLASLVALPLYFKDEQLGFVVLEVGPRVGWVYEALRDQLSTALHDALLAQREREALAALERARDELEQRVTERTAELAQANEVLTEQILERQRAEVTRSRLEGQLRQAQKMEAVGRLAGGIAHDFNNILVVINGYSDLVLRELPSDDPIRVDIEQIRVAGERAANLTQRLLAFGRQQVLEPTVLDLNDVVRSLEPMLKRLISEDVRLETELAPALRPISADLGQIEQIVLNLVVNARDAMPTGGRLTIETANVDIDEEAARADVGVSAGPRVVLRVRDTGVGMDAATRARLFEPFFTTKPAGRGTGLGLATVFGIVQQSGGHIRVVSEPGAGTTFEIYLPETEAREAEPEQPPLARESLSGSETILLVEDDAGVRGAARRFLEEHGYRVLEADDERDALRLAEQHEGPLDLVVTDVVMPELSGPELVERVTRIRPETSVLYVSGYTDSSLIREGLSTSTIVLLQKPFTADALARKVRDALDRGYARDVRAPAAPPTAQ